MWIYTALIATFSITYYFLGIAPIVYGVWYGMWWMFWLGIVAWIVNCMLVWCVRKSRMLD
jgi:hypothetical protein